MKPRTLYAFCAAAIIIILLSMWINRESAKIQSLLQEEIKTRQVVPRTQPRALPPYSPELQPISNNKPASAITIIRPPPKQETIPITAERGERIKKSQSSERITVPSVRGPVVSEEEADNLEGESSSGITKINKLPTEEESNEMNAQGIVMY